MAVSSAGTISRSTSLDATARFSRGAVVQGRTLLHFLAQRKHILWDRGCV